MAVRILDDNLINQIAAGEVVERPASVVKELVENAIDAGGDQIVIDMLDGGRTLINVADNGRGISKEDLTRCIMRHATSKLADDDLLNINTFGFRGEALPSIASVSNMTISSAHDGVGFKLDASTGTISPSPIEIGTAVRVENLFGRVPARLKFLRSDRFEIASAREVVMRLALANPDIGFVFNQNLRFPKSQDLFERVLEIVGSDAQGRLLPVDMTDSEIKVWGWVSEPTLRRTSSVDQYLFVNGRPVKDKVLIGALRAAFFDVMSARDFPIAVLYLELPTSSVDVNVSPAKTEVHFLEPARVRSLIVRALRAAISKTMTEVSAPVVRNESAPVQTNFTSGFFNANSVKTPGFEFAESFTPATIDNGFDLPLGRVIGQIMNKYILAENAEGLVLVDQHAAHERLTYEKLRAHKMLTQPLLIPKVIDMLPVDADAVLQVAEHLSASGLEIESFGDASVVIRRVPVGWDFDWADMLKAVAGEVRTRGASTALEERLHLKLANFACHRSVRAGQSLSIDEMNALLRQIESSERAGQCNHGRPVWKQITLSSLDSMFERI